MTNQWFNNYSPLSVDGQCQNEDWQCEGLGETCSFIHRLPRHEISIIGAENVILGALSQGCAASLVALLLWDGPPFKAMFGMCGWLPMRKRVKEMRDTPPPDDGDDHVFHFFNDQCASTNTSFDGHAQALQYLHDQLDFSSNASAPAEAFRQTPIFLGHGVLDDKVPIGLGREAACCLQLLGARVEKREYQDLGHWYSPQMQGDVVQFLTRVGKETSISGTHEAQPAVKPSQELVTAT